MVAKTVNGILRFVSLFVVLLTVLSIVIVPLLFPNSVQQKVFFHPLPLTMGIWNPLIFIVIMLFTLFSQHFCVNPHLRVAPKHW